MRRTREELGLEQDQRVLRLPDDLEVVRDWFRGSGIEKLVVSAGVRELGDSSFYGCAGLREVLFEPGSRLQRIGSRCFRRCGLTKVAIPGSVQDIGEKAFAGCRGLSSLSFEADSRLSHVGSHAFQNTQLKSGELRYPNAVDEEPSGFFEFCSDDEWMMG